MTYDLLVWGNTYLSTIKPVTPLQKKAVRIVTFSRYDEHTSLIFKRYYICNITKFADVIYIHNALFMYQFTNRLLPPAFINFSQSVSSMHSYNTRLASKSTYSLPFARTNYGKFDLCFLGAQIWNGIDEFTNLLPQNSLIKKLKKGFIQNY